MENRYDKRRKRNMYRRILILVQWVIIAILTIALIIMIVAYNNVSRQLKEKNRDTSAATGATGEISETTVSDSISFGETGNNSFSNSMASTSGTSSSDGSMPTTSKNESKASKIESTASNSVPASGKETDQWYLKLANPDVSVSKSFISSVKLGKINTKYVVDTSKETCLYMDARAVDAFNSMCKAAANDGVKMYSVSSYRSYSYQQSLYNNKVARVKKANPSLSDKEAKAEAATVVALPGTSEHHLGLAVDINSVEEDFEDTKQFRWLQEHAAEYGFIMRYPKDKQNITKIIYEPWHYRYVGIEHAKAMKANGMCLEEYIEYLKSLGK